MSYHWGRMMTSLSASLWFRNKLQSFALSINLNWFDLIQRISTPRKPVIRLCGRRRFYRSLKLPFSPPRERKRIQWCMWLVVSLISLQTLLLPMYCVFLSKKCWFSDCCCHLYSINITGRDRSVHYRLIWTCKFTLIGGLKAHKHLHLFYLKQPPA